MYLFLVVCVCADSGFAINSVINVYSTHLSQRRRYTRIFPVIECVYSFK